MTRDYSIIQTHGWELCGGGVIGVVWGWGGDVYVVKLDCEWEGKGRRLWKGIFGWGCGFWRYINRVWG